MNRFRPSDLRYTKAILEWVCYAKCPMQKEEILQVLMVHKGDEVLVAERRILHDLNLFGASLLEYEGDLVTFIYFTAEDKDSPTPLKQILGVNLLKSMETVRSLIEVGAGCTPSIRTSRP